MKVVIVARTKLGGAVCVGALDQDFRSLRLYDAGWKFPANNSPYQIGGMWEMELEWKPDPRPPHLEDVLVKARTHLKDIPNLRDYLLGNIEPWEGGVTDLFEHKLKFTHQDRGYIEAPNLPSRSTWFWIPHHELKSTDVGGKVYYSYNGAFKVSYVGVAPPLGIIPAGSLVRVSLARWWKPDNADPTLAERCYLQLSGWYL